MADQQYPMGIKEVGTSFSVATHMIRHEDINGYNRLFGGRLMEWIDDVAGIAARRHAGIDITTAAIDTLEFKSPAWLNDIVIIEAWVTHVGNTSMEVRADSYVEDPATGERTMINHAYLTEVCVGPDGHPTPVPWGLVATNDEQRAECIAARKRAENRKVRRSQGF
ncbi:MAG: acyl-CoA thioesterase [Atopobiaceae bacterium]|nr:acyl-CoA thioesterase [Atopobiaceae bacterium]MDO4404973.1 acyl-CoA thioesterase [Atopobiaceae bacterium]